jgi:transcriptional regulator with XRE-family HTH domain
MTPEIDGAPALTIHFQRQAGASLRLARIRAGLSAEDVAQQTHVPLTIVERFENGVAPDITLQQLMDLALASGSVPLDLPLVPIKEAEEYASEYARSPSSTDLESWKARRDVRTALDAVKSTTKPRR